MRAARESRAMPAAQAMYRQATEIRRVSLGEHHSETLAGLQRLATVHWNLGDTAAAAEMLEKALESLEKEHPQREPLQHSLALVCHTRGDMAFASGGDHWRRIPVSLNASIASVRTTRRPCAISALVAHNGKRCCRHWRKAAADAK